ncbi:hypothetical protein CMK16_15195, partial [Candidatus Poribacteria bacterium]|nr:hypothetical protein [Candidatus Poribacteria bacterium]
MKKDYPLWRYHFLKVFGVGFLLISGFLQLVYTDQNDFVLVDSPRKQNFIGRVITFKTDGDFSVSEIDFDVFNRARFEIGEFGL